MILNGLNIDVPYYNDILNKIQDVKQNETNEIVINKRIIYFIIANINLYKMKVLSNSLKYIPNLKGLKFGCIIIFK